MRPLHRTSSCRTGQRHRCRADEFSAVPVILSAAVLIRLRVEPKPELALPIAVALLGDVHDHGRLLGQLLQLRLRRSVAAIGSFSRNPDLVFELSVAPDTEDI